MSITINPLNHSLSNLSTLPAVEVKEDPHASEPFVDINQIFTARVASAKNPPKRVSFTAEHVLNYFQQKGVHIALTLEEQQVLSEALDNLPYSYFPTLLSLFGLYFYRFLKKHQQEASCKLCACSFASFPIGILMGQLVDENSQKSFTVKTLEEVQNNFKEILHLSENLSKKLQGKINNLISLSNKLLLMPPELLFENPFVTMGNKRVSKELHQPLEQPPLAPCSPLATFMALDSLGHSKSPRESLAIAISIIELHLQYSLWAREEYLSPLIYKTFIDTLTKIKEGLDPRKLSDQTANIKYITDAEKLIRVLTEQIAINNSDPDNIKFEKLKKRSLNNYLIDFVLPHIRQILQNKVSDQHFLEKLRIRFFNSIMQFRKYMDYSSTATTRWSILLNKDFRIIFNRVFLFPNNSFFKKMDGYLGQENQSDLSQALVATHPLSINLDSALFELHKLYKKYSQIGTYLQACGKHSEVHSLQTAYFNQCCWFLSLFQLLKDSKNIRRKNTKKLDDLRIPSTLMALFHLNIRKGLLSASPTPKREIEASPTVEITVTPPLKPTTSIKEPNLRTTKIGKRNRNRKDIETVVKELGWKIKTTPSGQKFKGKGSHKTWISPGGLFQVTISNSTKIGTLKSMEKTIFQWIRINKQPLLKKGYIFEANSV